MKKNIDPRMHSAEHILNQTMDRMFNCGRCFNAHIERKKSKCDYRFNRPLSQKELQEIQTRSTGSSQRICRLPKNTYPNQRHCATTIPKNCQAMPDDTIRIVQIGDYDACPCIGPHVKSSGEISGFQITSSSFDESVLRIRFKLTPINELLMQMVLKNPNS